MPVILKRKVVGAVASIITDTTLFPHTAYRVQVRLLTKVLAESHFLVEPLSHEHVTAACAALQSVCAIVGATHVLSVVNVSDKPFDLRASTQIAVISSITLQTTTSSNSAAIHHLPRDEKIWKVFVDLQFDAIKLDTPTKVKMLEMIDDFIEVFAECDSDVGVTNVVFYKIKTGDSRPIRQPARFLRYGNQRDVV